MIAYLKNKVSGTSSCEEHVAKESDVLENDELFTDKEFKDVLILSDSIYRHIGGAIPRDEKFKGPLYRELDIENIDVLKCVIPGARVDRLWSEAVAISQKYNFREIIIHVGSNYIPSPQACRRNYYFPMRNFIVNDIKDLLGAVSDLFNCHVTFSSILPRLNMTFFRLIRNLNIEINEYCRLRFFGVIRCNAFALNNENRLDHRLFARQDGIHLGRMGIDVLFYSLREHILYELSDDDPWLP